MANRTVRVWLNHWFSAAYHIVRMIKADDETEFHVIGSSENPDSVIQLACDEWYTEPAYEGSGYVDFCLDFCKEKRVEIFAPRRGMKHIARRRAEFEAIGTALLCDDDYRRIEMLDDKALAYESIKSFAPEAVPPYKTVSTGAELAEAYAELAAQHPRVCMKYASDEGAVSFREIVPSKQLPTLRYISDRKVTPDEAARMIDGGSGRQLLVMPYLTGTEVSADCLKTAHGNIILPRFKLGGRVAEVRYDEELMRLCGRLLEEIPLSSPCNIQFRYYNGRPYFLEINTRMSGGIQLSCLMAEVNIPNIAVNQLINIDKEWTAAQNPRRAAHVEMPVLL